MSVAYGPGLKNLFASDETQDLFLTMMLEYVRSQMTKNALQIVESNRTVVAEALMTIGPDSIRAFVTDKVVADYRLTLFDNSVAKESWKPVSLSAKTLAECYFGVN
jgi:hypothetical protein